MQEAGIQRRRLSSSSSPSSSGEGAVISTEARAGAAVYWNNNAQVTATANSVANAGYDAGFTCTARVVVETVYSCGGVSAGEMLDVLGILQHNSLVI